MHIFGTTGSGRVLVRMLMNSVMYTSVHCECVVSANGCIKVALSLPCCCCAIHLVFGSTTDKHCKLKKVLLMRIPTVTILYPCGGSSQKTRLNSAAGWMMLGSICQREDPMQTANALDIVRALLDAAAAI